MSDVEKSSEVEKSIENEKIGIEESQKKYGSIVTWLKESEIYQFLAENTSTRIAILTFLFALFSIIAQLIISAFKSGYLGVYKISLENVGYLPDKNFISLTIDGIMFILMLYPTKYFFDVLMDISWHRQLNRDIKYFEKIGGQKFPYRKSKRWQNLLFLILLAMSFTALAASLFLATIPGAIREVSNWIIVGVVLLFAEIILAVILFCFKKFNQPLSKELNKKRNNGLSNSEKPAEHISEKRLNTRVWDISSIIMLIVIYAAGSFLSGASSANTKKTYPIINNEYAVVHQDNEKYWAVSIVISGNDAVIHTNKHRVYNVEGQEIVFCTFEQVKITN